MIGTVKIYHSYYSVCCRIHYLTSLNHGLKTNEKDVSVIN